MKKFNMKGIEENLKLFLNIGKRFISNTHAACYFLKKPLPSK